MVSFVPFVPFVAMLVSAAPEPDPDPEGRRVYEERCLECHGPAGYGNGPHRWLLPTPPFDLTSPHMQREMSDDEIFRVVTDGIREKNMPSFKHRLTDEERRAVVRFVRFIGRQAAPPEHPEDGPHAEHAAADADHDAHGQERWLPWPTSREASGTAWLPDSSPMYGLMRHDDGFMLMVHGNVTSGANLQTTPRGDVEVTTLSWLMPMIAHDVPGGNLMGRVMVSLEPFTLPGDGYALLLQTGETWRGRPLRDRQHPHDLLMEAAALYRTRPVAGISGELYVAPAGEPALGPAAFPHRASAMGDPFAPLSHHWLDSTHITFGVVTAGLATRVLKVEGSVFNGREPDEQRLDVDLAVPQSWSLRASAAPHEDIALQASYGRLVGPELLEPDEIVHRTTASLTWNQPLADGNWASMLAFGNNTVDPVAGAAAASSSAVLLESTLELERRHVLFGRAEVVGKETRELGVTIPEDIVYVPAVSVGYQHVFDPAFEFVPALGVRGSAALVDEKLASAYGARVPVGAFVYVMVRGAHMQMQPSDGATTRQSP